MKASLDISPTPHGELAMADAAEPADVAVDRDIVGRVGEDEIGALALQQALEVVRVAGIAADQPMAARAATRRPAG